MVPEGTYSAASFPSNRAVTSWSRLTQGSSPKTSSPTSASTMARRMPGEGLVTVSLRRSIMLVRSLAIPLAVEHLDGGASHIDLIICLVPFEFQTSATQVPGHPAPRMAGEMTGHRHRRSPCTAGQGFARAAFPDAHGEGLGVEHPYKLSIDALRKGRVVLKARAPRRHVKRLRVIHEDDTVRVAHRDSCDLKRGAIDHKRFAQHPPRRSLHRNLGPFQKRFTHFHTDLFYHPMAGKELQCEHARQSLDLDGGLLCHPTVIDILGQAPNAIATHLRFTAVRVEHAHAEISLGGGQDQDQAIRAHTKVPVTDRPRHLRRMVDLLLEAIDIDIVIPYAMHFGEFHARTSREEVCPSAMLTVLYQR